MPAVPCPAHRRLQQSARDAVALARRLLLRAARREYVGEVCHSRSLPAECFEMIRPEHAMKHKAVRELFDYWQGLRGNRRAPERAEIDLAAIRGLIADMFMLEIDAAYRFPFVLSGTRVNALACTEQNGRSFLELWAASDRQNVAAIILTVLEASHPVVATAIATSIGFPDHMIDILLLPLGQRGHDRARILGLIASPPPPSWVGLLPITDLHLSSLQGVDALATPSAFDFLPLRTPLPVRALARPSGRPSKKVPYLRVFDGGRKFS